MLHYVMSIMLKAFTNITAIWNVQNDAIATKPKTHHGYKATRLSNAKIQKCENYATYAVTEKNL